jgi:hypothetical protein
VSARRYVVVDEQAAGLAVVVDEHAAGLAVGAVVGDDGGPTLVTGPYDSLIEAQAELLVRVGAEPDTASAVAAIERRARRARRAA